MLHQLVGLWTQNEQTTSQFSKVLRKEFSANVHKISGGEVSFFSLLALWSFVLIVRTNLIAAPLRELLPI